MSIGKKGGYHPESRLATLVDEIKMEAIAAAGDSSAVARQRAVAEIERLALQVNSLLAHMA